MSYIGDFTIGSTFDKKFTSIDAGVPATLSGSPVVSAYVDNDTTQLTAGITLTADFDSVTGLNNVRVVATVANGYAAGKNYALVITTGTIGGKSAVGYVIGDFSIDNRSVAAVPTANANADALLDRAAGIETSYTLRQALRIMLAALAGKLSGAATTSVSIRDVNDTKNRVSATVDSDGNRTAVTLDAT